MIFFSRIATLYIALIVATPFAIWAVRKAPMGLRVAAIVIAVAIGGLSLLLLSLFAIDRAARYVSSEAPVYSADKSFAARAETHEINMFGGDTTVWLYSKHGLQRESVFFGGIRTVVGLKWSDPRTLVITYVDGPSQCTQARSVKIVCYLLPEDRPHTSTGSSASTGEPNTSR